MLHLHDWGKMEVCLINYNKGEDDEVFKNLQYSEMFGKLLKGCLESTVPYDSISVEVQ